MYPAMAVLNTTSPATDRVAPYERPESSVPSSNTSFMKRPEPSLTPPTAQHKADRAQRRRNGGSPGCGAPRPSAGSEANDCAAPGEARAECGRRQKLAALEPTGPNTLVQGDGNARRRRVSVPLDIVVDLVVR